MSTVDKSLRRHNKLNHGGINGTLHLGNWKHKPRPNSHKAKLQDDQPAPLKVPILEIVSIQMEQRKTDDSYIITATTKYRVWR